MAFWNKLTFEQYFRVINSKNDPDLLKAAILGKDWQNLPAFEAINTINQYDFSEPFPDITGKPDSIMGVKIPDDLGWLSVGQFEDMVAIGQNDSMMDWPKIVAVFLDKELHGDYNYVRAMDNEVNVWQANGLEVHKFVSFFFSKLPEYLNGIKRGQKEGATPVSKKWQAIQKLMMSSGSKRSYTD